MYSTDGVQTMEAAAETVEYLRVLKAENGPAAALEFEMEYEAYLFLLGSAACRLTDDEQAQVLDMMLDLA